MALCLHGLHLLHYTSITRRNMAFYLHAVHLPHYTSITHRMHGLLTPRSPSPALHVNHTQNTWPSSSMLYISCITRQSHAEYMAFYLHAAHLPHYTSITPRINGLLPPRCTSPALHVNHTQNTWPSSSMLYISCITRQSHAEYMALYLHAVHLPHYTSHALHVNHTQNTWSSISVLYVSLITRQSHAEYMAFYLHAVHLLHYTSITPTVHGLLAPRCKSPSWTAWR